MTNPIAFSIAFVLVLLGMADYIFNDADYLLYLTKKFMGLLNWVQFWR